MKLLPGKVETALTDTGESLLPESDWDRKISWPTLSKDGRTVLLDVDLKIPDQRVKSLKTLSGTFGYLTSGGNHSLVDLGIDTFEKEDVGNKFGAKVISADGNSFEISVDVVKDSIKSVTLYDGQGKKVDPLISYSWSSMYTLLKFSPMRQGQQLPLHGKIELEMLADVKVYEARFDMVDIPLLGR